ncbi:unnamed protein product [Lymnaea stagnalis]|uniref:Uncharacterized protein n=1 Tax=Lymnaea stagnalis TaxID=6523 RepID=A0AAV2HGR0_LYMST
MKIVEISKNIIEQNKLEEQIRALETAAKDKNEMAVAEKEALEKKLQEYQICKTVDTKENQTSILLKWEQRCSDLNNQLKMERNKVKSLTQQLEKLGKSQTIGNSEEVESLKAELLEVKEERDYYSDELTAMCQKAERHFKTIKELKQQNDYCSSKLKIMKSMLQVEKNKNKGIVNSSQMPQIACFNIKSDNVNNLQIIQGQTIEFEAGNSVPPDLVIINETDVKPLVNEIENKNRVDMSDIGSVAVESSAKINPVLNSYSEMNHLKSPSQRQNVNKSPSGTKRDQSISTPSLSIKKSKNSEDGSFLKTPKQSSKKSKIATPSKSSKCVVPSTFSEEIKTKCKMNTSTIGKLNNSDRSQDLMIIREKLPSSKEATGTSLTAGPNHKLSSLPCGPKTIPAITVNDKITDTNLSTRITRRMSLQKRRSTEQSQEAVDGKKMKLSIEETIPETKPEIKPPSKRTRQQAQQISKPQSSPKKCSLALPNSNVLATITNSPKKSVPPNDSSKSRVRHLRSPKHKTAPTAKGSPGGKSECNQQ